MPSPPTTWAKSSWGPSDSLMLYQALNDIGLSIKTWYGQVDANAQNLINLGAVTAGSLATAGALTAASLAIATNVLATNSGKVGIGVASAMQAALHIQDSAGDNNLYLSHFAPSIKFSNSPTLAGATTIGLIAMATAPGQYTLPNAGDFLIGTQGAVRGNIYINPNYNGGTGKSILLYGLTVLPNLPSVNPGSGFKMLWYDPVTKHVMYEP